MAKLIKEDLAIVKEMYSQAGKGEHFKKNIEPLVKTQEDLADLVANSFGNKNTRTQFDGVLVENEFVSQLYNIYRQRLLTLLKGEIPYINMFLKEAPFSGSQGYISEDIKAGKDFSSIFATSTFNPEKRIAYLQVISTSIRRTYDDELSITIISRAGDKQGGLNAYMNQRISYLEEDFTAEIRLAMLAIFDAVKGKELTITVPTELQGVMQKEQRARFILEKITTEMLNIKDNSSEYSDNGFHTRTPKNELVAIMTRSAKAELDVQGFAMFRQKGAEAGISVSKIADVPDTAAYYMKIMTPQKIHYSNSINVSGLDIIHMNMKGVYSKQKWTELDMVDSEPALTIIVEDAVSADASTKAAKHDYVSVKIEEPVQRIKSTLARRQEFYNKLSDIYKSKDIIKAPAPELKNTEDLEV